MQQDTEKILESMRLMAWVRAKGELKSMLCTYYSSASNKVHEVVTFSNLDQKINLFIKDIEDNLL